MAFENNLFTVTETEVEMTSETNAHCKGCDGCNGCAHFTEM